MRLRSPDDSREIGWSIGALLIDRFVRLFDSLFVCLFVCGHIYSLIHWFIDWKYVHYFTALPCICAFIYVCMYVCVFRWWRTCVVTRCPPSCTHSLKSFVKHTSAPPFISSSHILYLLTYCVALKAGFHGRVLSSATCKIYNKVK